MQPVLAEDLLTYTFLSQVTMSPSGERAAFIARQADAAQNDYRADIYIINLAGGEAQRITSAAQNGPFVWEPDGDSLLFVSRGEGEGEVSPLYRVAGEKDPERIAVLPRRVQSLARMDDGTFLYTAWVDLPTASSNDPDGCEVLDELPYWSNDTKGFVNKRRIHLFRFDPKNAREDELTTGPLQVQSFGARGNRVAFVTKDYTDKMPLLDDLWLLDVASGTRTCLSHGEYAFGAGAGGQPAPQFLSDDALVILGTDMRRYGLRQSWEALMIDVQTGRVQSLTPTWCDEQLGTPGSQRLLSDCRLGGGPVERVDEGRFYFPATERDSVYLYAVDMAGQLERVLGMQGSVDSFDVRHGAIVYVALRERNLQEIYIMKDGQERRLTHFNDACLADRAISVPEPFAFRTQDGVDIDAWMMKPVDFDPAKRYPSILLVRGGPKASSGSIFFHELQMFAGLGYAIYFCNPRGSAGRGDEFGDLRGVWGTVDYDDLMTLVDHVVDAYPFIDPERIGVMGGSYGGYMVNWIIGHTDRFRAACSQRSISNWISFFCLSDIGYYFTADQLAATPWDEDGGDKLWWHSPLKYAHNAKTPTLFLNSDRDYMCWIDEGMQMFYALRYHGVDSRLVLFEGENHDLSRSGKPTNRMRRLREMITWFDRYLKS